MRQWSQHTNRTVSSLSANIMQKKNFEKGLAAIEVVPDMHKDFLPSMQGSWSITSKVLL